MFFRCSLISIAVWFSLQCYAADPKDFQAAIGRGLEAMTQSNYKAARTSYLDAIGIARELKINPQVLAEYIYQAGQASGLACQFDEAEKLLAESILLTESKPQDVTGVHSAATWKIFELAHFYSDRGLYAQSYPYWSRFLPRYEELNKKSVQDPIAYAMILREYGRALNATGNQRHSAEIIEKAERITADNAEKFMRIAWYKYGKNCK